MFPSSNNFTELVLLHIVEICMVTIATVSYFPE